MGYRDDFYITENITGYTGTLHADASVYFENDTGNGIEFGRITQNHDHKLNIVRNAVRTKADYRIGNQLVDGEMKCVEFYGGRVQHQSRHTFVPVDALTAVQLAVLERSIYNFTERKGKYTASAQAKVADRATETRTARSTIAKRNTESLLARHQQKIDEATPR